MKWNELNPAEFMLKKKDRIFRLREGSRGVWGIGKCFYLSTKLVNETEFHAVKDIVYMDDNHGLAKDVKDRNIPEILKIAEKYIKAYF